MTRTISPPALDQTATFGELWIPGPKAATGRSPEPEDTLAMTPPQMLILGRTEIVRRIAVVPA